MNIQNSITVVFGVYSLIGFILGVKNTRFKKNPYGLTPWFNLIGSFVWVDAVAFGLFFFLASLASLIFQNLTLLLLIFSVFWVIRSAGETIYWFLEQFANPHKNIPETLKGYSFFPGDSIYIHYQIFWQCVSVASIIAAIYFFVVFIQQL